MTNTNLNLDLLLHSAIEHHQAGRLVQAETLYRQILRQNPRHADALHLLGVLAIQHKQYDAAVNLIREAIALKPRFADAFNNLGDALRENKQLDEAIAAYRQAIALKPEVAEVHYNLGNALWDKQRPDEAIPAYRQAVAIRPNYAKALNNLASSLKDQRQFEEAAQFYRQAIAAQPDYAPAHFNLGNVLFDQGLLDHAAAAYRQAIALAPQLSGAHSNLGNVLKEQGRVKEAIEEHRRAIALQPNDPTPHSILLYTLQMQPDIQAAAIAEELGSWNRQHAEPLRSLIPSHGNDRNPDRRLCIGYVSPDLHEHAVGRFLLPLLANHDKTQVEIFAYSPSPASDVIAERLHRHIDIWRNIAGFSDAQAADLILQDRIDILVDLSLHTARNRLLVFARKPAPVQVSYLAYCSSTGLNTIDYRISDPYLDPPEKQEGFYSEETFRLPKSYWCFEPLRGLPEVSLLPAHRQGVITFGCLNRFCKVSPAALATWAKILQAVSNSRLLLHAHEGVHREEVHQFMHRQSAGAIKSERILFTGRVPLQDYFHLYDNIDIALDTFPYAGGTTTCDALWMGAPVVSLAGKMAVGRGGISILSNVGLPDLVANDEENYVRIACMLAEDLAWLKELRATMRERMRCSPLMDGPRFARNIEHAYRQMWHRWCAGSDPSWHGHPARKANRDV